jgi:hypothetical protein
MFEKDQLSVGDWIVYYLIMAIPLVNLIMFFVILGNSNANKTLKSFMLAGLVLGSVVVILYFTIFASILGSLGSLPF